MIFFVSLKGGDIPFNQYCDEVFVATVILILVCSSVLVGGVLAGGKGGSVDTSFDWLDSWTGIFTHSKLLSFLKHRLHQRKLKTGLREEFLVMSFIMKHMSATT